MSPTLAPGGEFGWVSPRDPRFAVGLLAWLPAPRSWGHGCFSVPLLAPWLLCPTVLLLWGLCGIRAAQSHLITPTPAVALSSF